VTSGTRSPVKGLRELVEGADSAKLKKARRYLAGRETQTLVGEFQKRFRLQRLNAWLIADVLSDRGVPPVFWYDQRSDNLLTETQQFDALTYDLRYLQGRFHLYPWPIRVREFQLTLAGSSESKLHRTAEWIWNGNKPMYFTVGRLAIPLEVQGGCVILAKAEVKSGRAGIREKRDAVYKALSEDIRKAPLSEQYDRDARQASVHRRMIIWWIAEMTGWKSASEVAALFQQVTGEVLSRQVVTKLMERIKAVLHDQEIARTKKRRLALKAILARVKEGVARAK
jgi:hypothetical protein